MLETSNLFANSLLWDYCVRYVVRLEIVLNIRGFSEVRSELIETLNAIKLD